MKLSGPAGGCSAEIIDNYEGKITGFYDLSEGDSTDRHDAEGWGNMFNFHNSLKLLQKGKREIGTGSLSTEGSMANNDKTKGDKRTSNNKRMEQTIQQKDTNENLAT